MAKAPSVPGAKKKKSKLAFLAVPLVLLIAAGLFFGPAKLFPAKEDAGKKGEKKVEKQREMAEATVDLGEFIINLKVPNNAQPRYVKVSLAIGVHSESVGEYVKEREAYFKDVIVERFAESTVEELGTSKGRTELRKQLQEEFSVMMPEGEKIDKVLFTQLAFQ